MPYDLTIPGWMPEAELLTLERLARTVPGGGTAVEVGPFCGRSSWCLANSMPASATLHCLDIWDPQEHPYTPPAAAADEAPGADFGQADTVQRTEGSLENFLHYTRDCPNIRPHRGRSPQDFGAWPLASANLVFLDGIHHNPFFAADLFHWLPRVKPGGILCGDDCARSHPDVLWTVHDAAKDLGLQFMVVGRIWIVPVAPRGFLDWR
jgi:hypothetical protein